MWLLSFWLITKLNFYVYKQKQKWYGNNICLERLSKQFTPIMDGNKWVCEVRERIEYRRYKP